MEHVERVCDCGIGPGLETSALVTASNLHPPAATHQGTACNQHLCDAGGDSDKFKEINEAYDVLRDPEKRKIYDEVRCCAGLWCTAT